MTRQRGTLRYALRLLLIGGLWMTVAKSLQGTPPPRSVTQAQTRKWRIRKPRRVWTTALARGIPIIVGVYIVTPIFSYFEEYDDAFQVAVAALLGATILFRSPVRSRYDVNSARATLGMAFAVIAWVLWDAFCGESRNLDYVRSVLFSVAFTAGVLIYLEIVYLLTSSKESVSPEEEKKKASAA